MSEHYRGKRSGRGAALWTAAVLAVVAMAASAAAFFLDPGAPAGPGLAAGDMSLSQGGASGSVPAQPAEGAASAPDPSQPVSAPGPAQPYDFGQPAPESPPVDNSYFDDAAFVGDSRTDGFMIYSGIGTGKNLTSNGLSIFKLGEKKALTIGGEQYTLLEALALEQYGKVYLSLGVNELGTYNDQGFYRCYGEAVDQIRRLQPNAVIYIQGLIPLNEGKIEEANGNKYHLTNDHLRVYNDLMRQVAQEKQVVFLDLYAQFADEDGALPEWASKDGVHLVKEYCQQWLEYLKTHTVDFEALYPDGAPLPEPAGYTTGPGERDTITDEGSAQG